MLSTSTWSTIAARSPGSAAITAALSRSASESMPLAACTRGQVARHLRVVAEEHALGVHAAQPAADLDDRDRGPLLDLDQHPVGPLAGHVGVRAPARAPRPAPRPPARSTETRARPSGTCAASVTAAASSTEVPRTSTPSTESHEENQSAQIGPHRPRASTQERRPAVLPACSQRRRHWRRANRRREASASAERASSATGAQQVEDQRPDLGDAAGAEGQHQVAGTRPGRPARARPRRGRAPGRPARPAAVRRRRPAPR